MPTNIELKVVGILSKKLFLSFGKVLDANKLENNEIILFCDYSSFDIPVGYIFNTIMDSSGSKCFSGNILLRNVSQAFALEFDSIPKGHKTICKFQFAEGIPEVVKKMSVIDDWYESDMYMIFSGVTL